MELSAQEIERIAIEILNGRSTRNETPGAKTGEQQQSKSNFKSKWHQLFEDAVKAGNYAEAEQILTQVEQLHDPNLSRALEMARAWMNSLKGSQEVQWPFPKDLQDDGTKEWAKRILGLQNETTITADLVKKTRRKMMMKFHPDTNPNPKARADLNEISKRVNKATDRLLKDLAMIGTDSNSFLKGGIDFNANVMNLQVQNNGGEIEFKMDAAMLQRLQNAPGFVPRIVNIQPMTDLQIFLGTKESAILAHN